MAAFSDAQQGAARLQLPSRQRLWDSSLWDSSLWDSTACLQLAL